LLFSKKGKVDKFDSFTAHYSVNDKVVLAEEVSEIFEDKDLDHLDLRAKASQLCEIIRKWNNF